MNRNILSTGATSFWGPPCWAAQHASSYAAAAAVAQQQHLLLQVRCWLPFGPALASRGLIVGI
jgi:hypothetical protein